MKKTSKKVQKLRKKVRFCLKNGQNASFFQKKFKKSLVIRKKVVPLHSHSEERSYEE